MAITELAQKKLSTPQFAEEFQKMKGYIPTSAQLNEFVRQRAGYLTADTPVVSTPEVITPAPTVTPAPETDFTKRFETYKAGQTAPIDFSTAETDAQAREDARKEAMRKVINERASSQRAATQELGKKKEEGYKVGLGISEGLNWSSLGTDAQATINQETLGEIAKINAAEQEALDSAETTSLDRVQSVLADLRKQKSEYEKSLIDNFNSIVNQEFQQKQEDRLASGQKITSENQIRDDARAVLDKLITNYSGSDFKELPQNIKDQINQLETQSGYPKGFVEQGLNTLKQQEAEQKAQLAQDKLDLSAPKTVKDGKKTLQWNADLKKWEVVNTGASTGTGTGTGTETFNEKEALNLANGYLSSVVGGDGFVSPDSYLTARNAWIQDGGNPTTFDSKFKGYRNPNNKNYVLSTKTATQKKAETGVEQQITDALTKYKDAGYTRNDLEKQIKTQFGSIPDPYKKQLDTLYGQSWVNKFNPFSI